MAYLSVLRRAEREYVVEKSKFIGYCAHTEGEANARAFLGEVRALHPTATHVCYGFVGGRRSCLKRRLPSCAISAG